MPSVASLSIGKNLAMSSVVCVKVKFEPSAGAEMDAFSSAWTPERGLNGSSSVIVCKLRAGWTRLYGAPVFTFAIEDAAIPNEPPKLFGDELIGLGVGPTKM